MNATKAREYFLIKRVKERPGINAADLTRDYNAGFKPVDVSGDILRLLGRAALVYGKAASGRGKGLYAPTDYKSLRAQGFCGWSGCGMRSTSYYCPQHKDQLNARRRKPKQALSMVEQEVVSNSCPPSRTKRGGTSSTRGQNAAE